MKERIENLIKHASGSVEPRVMKFKSGIFLNVYLLKEIVGGAYSALV